MHATSYFYTLLIFSSLCARAPYSLDDFLSRYKDYARTFAAKSFGERQAVDRSEIEDALRYAELSEGDKIDAVHYIKCLVRMTQSVHGPYHGPAVVPYRVFPDGWTAVATGAPEYGYWVPWVAEELPFDVLAGQMRFKAHIKGEMTFSLRYLDASGGAQEASFQVSNVGYNEETHPWYHIQIDKGKVIFSRRASSRGRSKFIRQELLTNDLKHLISFGFGKGEGDAVCLSHLSASVYFDITQFNNLAYAFEQSLRDKTIDELRRLTADSIKEALYYDYLHKPPKEARQFINRVLLTARVAVFEQALSILFSPSFLDAMSSADQMLRLAPGVVEREIQERFGINYTELVAAISLNEALMIRLADSIAITRERISNRIHNLPDRGLTRSDEAYTLNMITPANPLPLEFEFYAKSNAGGILNIDLDFFDLSGRPRERVSIVLRQPPSLAGSQMNIVSTSVGGNGHFVISNGKMRYQLSPLFDDLVRPCRWGYYKVRMTESQVSVEFVYRDDHGIIIAQGSLTDPESDYVTSQTNMYLTTASSAGVHTSPSLAGLLLECYAITPLASIGGGAHYSSFQFRDTSDRALTAFSVFKVMATERYSSDSISHMDQEELVAVLRDDYVALKDALLYEKTNPEQEDRLLDLLSSYSLFDQYDEATRIFSRIKSDLHTVRNTFLRGALIALKDGLQSDYSTAIIEAMTLEQLTAFDASDVAVSRSYYEILYQTEGITDVASLRGEVVAVFNAIVSAIANRIADITGSGGETFEKKLAHVVLQQEKFKENVPSKLQVMTAVLDYASHVERMKDLLLVEQQGIWLESTRDSNWYQKEAIHAEQVSVATRFLIQVYELLADLDKNKYASGEAWRILQELRESFELRIVSREE